ncbi:MAG: sugar ABC transporter permease [Anaerolineales bacterium]|nr:sugar ABC transporter permease [Anaerolineales bacterium]
MSVTSSSHPQTTPHRKHVRWIDIREGFTGCLFILPAFAIIGLFGLFPIGFAVYVSMHRWRITQGRFLGLDNYVKSLDNLAYVIFFWLVAILLYLVARNLTKTIKNARQHGDNLWIWLLPAVVTTAGIGQFLVFFVRLLPEILSIPEKMKGQVRTQELFMQYLGEAWRVPEVQSALWISILLLAVAQGLAYLVNRYLSKSPIGTSYYTSLISVLILAASALLLGWYTWSEIQRAYTEAFEAGEQLEIWAQVITISAGFLLLLLSWQFWRSAPRQTSNVQLILRMVAAIMLIIGAWILVGELPRVIAAGDKDWWEGLQVTAYYSIGTVPLQLGISLVLATLLFQKIRGKSLYRLIFFLPYITPAVAAAAVFRVFFSSRPSAPVNGLMGLFGLEPLRWLDEPQGILTLIFGANTSIPDWAVGPSLALIVIIIYNIWSYVGYDTVIFLAGLGGIPSELYEAAAIDGAGRWAQFRNITLPLLSPTTYFLTLLAVIGTFKAFNHVWVMRTGAALGTTDTASIVIFTEFNRNTQYGYAASLSFVLLGVILLLTIINNRIAEERVFYG